MYCLNLDDARKAEMKIKCPLVLSRGLHWLWWNDFFMTWFQSTALGPIEYSKWFCGCLRLTLCTAASEPSHLFLWPVFIGVLLLNAVLTVRAHQANSHKEQGWEQFTDAVVAWLNQNLNGLVFLLWGSYAQKKGSVIDRVWSFKNI